MPKQSKKDTKPKLPPAHNWRTTDDDEINKRRQRALDESFAITNLTPKFPIFSNFRVGSGSGQNYSVEIRDLANRHFACDCVDFRTNGLGTCKHVEAVLLLLQSRYKKIFKVAHESGSNRIEIVLDRSVGTLRLAGDLEELPRAISKMFDSEGKSLGDNLTLVVESLQKLRKNEYPQIRLSQEIAPWMEQSRRAIEQKQLRHEYELRVQRGEWPMQETSVPLFPYQREGMLHLAFKERALLADEMGLGKTIQAIAACALLHRLGKAKRVLVVTPASLKTEWEEQIRHFTSLSYQLVFGNKLKRLSAYSVGIEARQGRDNTSDETSASLPKNERDSTHSDRSGCPFFTIVNYEQMVSDALDVNHRLAPDIVVLDEAQRIKNWGTKTAQAVKRLTSRYAFVLTGTPIENRIDELRSLVDYLDPAVLGPLFRFNRDFYDLDEKGRPVGYRNLDELHRRIKPYLLRRRKEEVETELPERTDRNHFVPLSPLQKQDYAAHEQQVSKLANIAQRRPLSVHEQEKLQRELAMLRMICDTTYILDPKDRTCPKLAEIEKLLEECADNEVKVIIFSEWEKMLELVRDHCNEHGIGYAWHTGSVPQQRRRGEINTFKDDPNCRVFLSTDAGATGLNLQNASVVINCDLPWNPAKLEQRIARAWRKHQTKPVTVFNLISENTIEHRMLETLALKQSLASSVLDMSGEVKELKLRTGRQAMVERLNQLITPANGKSATLEAGKEAGKQNTSDSVGTKRLSADPSITFSQLAYERLGPALLRCEERYPQEGSHSVLMVVVDRDAALWSETLKSIHRDLSDSHRNAPEALGQFQVIDQATDEAIQRLISAGLIGKTTRATRPLYPSSGDKEVPMLTEEEQAKLKACRELASRKLKMARVLGNTGFIEETRAALLEAIQALGSAFAVEIRCSQTLGLTEMFQPPLSLRWRGASTILKNFVQDSTASWKTAAEQLACALSTEG